MDSMKHECHGGLSLSRRSFLSGLAALGTGALIQGGQSVAQTPSNDPRRIDVHPHFTPPAYLEFTRANNRAAGPGPGRGGRGDGLGSAYAGWTLAEDLEDMDKSGTATAL